MTKAEIASYLVSLHTLMEAQSKGSKSIPSTMFADEYEKHWGLLKEMVQKENENETGSSDRERGFGPKDRTGIESSEPSLRGPNWDQTGRADAANVPRSRIPSPDAG